MHEAEKFLGWLKSMSDWSYHLIRGALTNLQHRSSSRRRLIIILAAILVSGYALGVLGYILYTPEVGIRVSFTPVVSRFYSDFLFPEGQTPLVEGDQLLFLGDRKVDTWSQFLRKLTDLNHESADVLPPNTTQAELLSGTGPAAGKTHVNFKGIELVRVAYQPVMGEGTEPRAVWCRLAHPPIEALLPSFLWFLLKVGLFTVGAIVFWNRPEDRAAVQFFLLCVVSLGAYMGGYHWWRIATQPILLIPFVVCAILLPAVSLHFYLVFPRAKQVVERHPTWVFLAIYGPAVCFLIVLISAYLNIRWLTHGTGSDQVDPVTVRALLRWLLLEIYAYFAVAALSYLVSVACLIHSYRTARDATERNQVKWILFGAMAALVPIGYSLYLAFAHQGRFAGGAASWPMFAASVCVTVAFTVSITRYRLMQLDQLISSGAIYFLFSSVAGLVYYGLVVATMLVAGSWIGDGPSFGQALVAGCSAIALMLGLDLVRGKLKTALDRHFRREKFQLDRTLLRMRQAIEQLVDPPALARRLLQTSAELFAAHRGAVYLRQGDPAIFHLVEAIGPPPALLELPPGCPLLERLVSQGALEARGRAGFEDAARRQLRFLGGEAAHALVHEGQLLGLLVLGPKDSGPYSAEDLNLLTAFTQLAVLALVSAEGHRTIETLNRDLQSKVEKIADQQRRILALQTQLTRQAIVNGVTERPEEVPTPSPNNGTHRSADKEINSDNILGTSGQVQNLMNLIRKVAIGQSAVLLRGESGTGKELLARAVHEHSSRACKPFIKVHCAALSPSLLESELFGHVKGAFTNAIRDKIGRFEAAHGGSLFLDEIGDINLDVQTKLLRVLQEMTFERVGSSEPLKVDVRVIAATHQNLEELMRQGRFREDLFYRLNVFPIQVPPLRERIEDVPELALHFLKIHGRLAGKNLTGMDDDALARLKAFDWPGNIRQLENVIERAVVIAEGDTITVRELPEELLTATAAASLDPVATASHWTAPYGTPLPSNGIQTETREPLSFQAECQERERRERDFLVRALASAGGNKAEAARALGMARSTLISRLKKLGLG